MERNAAIQLEHNAQSNSPCGKHATNNGVLPDFFDGSQTWPPRPTLFGNSTMVRRDSEISIREPPVSKQPGISQTLPLVHNQGIIAPVVLSRAVSQEFLSLPILVTELDLSLSSERSSSGCSTYMNKGLRLASDKAIADLVVGYCPRMLVHITNRLHGMEKTARI